MTQYNKKLYVPMNIAKYTRCKTNFINNFINTSSSS